MKLRNFLERFILVAIILVIIQTFLSELAIIKQWSLDAKNILIFTGLAFDITFTVEFIVRTVVARKENGVKFYWFHQRGWIDFLSSIPLLLLNSGPSVYFILNSHDMHDAMASIGTMNVLKIIKIIRITRILRLIRIVKILGRIHNTDSPMAQHHSSYIATAAVFSTMVVLILFAFLGRDIGHLANTRMAHYDKIVRTIEEIAPDKEKRNEQLIKFFENDPLVLRFTYLNKDLLTYNEKYLHNNYSFDEYIVVKEDNYSIYLCIKDINAEHAFSTMEAFFIILTITFVTAFIYARHFALTITDIIYIISKGMKRRDYNLEVKIRPEYEDHEINQLAKYYNESFLPAKMKKYGNAETQSLSIKDILKFK